MKEILLYTLEYFKLLSSQDLVNFLVKDLILSAIITTVVLKVFEWMRLRRMAKDTVKFICRNNFPTRNALRGKHLVDRLLDIYNNGKPMPLVSRDVVYARLNFWRSVWNENVIDNILQAKKLVEIFEEQGVRKVRLSEDKFTDTVIRYLIKMADRGQI